MVYTPPNQPAPSETPGQLSSLDHCPAEEDIPVPRRKYDDLNLRYSQHQNNYANVQQQCEKIQAENIMFSYATIKCNLGQLIFLTGLTFGIFEWLFAKIEGCVERICQKLTLQDYLLVLLMKLRLGLSNTDLAYRFKV